MEDLNLNFLTLTVILAGLLVTLLFRRRRRSPPSSPKPPSPPKLPILGHLHLLTDMPHHSLSRLAGQLGPIIYLQLGRVPTVVVSSARLAGQILKTHDHAFASRPQLIAAQYISFGCSDVTFAPSGAYWRQARKICVAELLGPKRVNSFRLIRDEETTRMVRSISAFCNSGSGTDMSERFFGLANDVLCRVAFGKRFDSESNRLSGVLAEAQALFAGFNVAEFYPGLEWVNSVTGLKRRLMRIKSELSVVCDEIIGEHLEKGNVAGSADVSVSDGEDFVDVLLRVQKGNKNLEVPITDDNLKGLVLDMFIAGTDTTSATLEWVMTELARHPSVMKRAQQEVQEVVGMKARVDETDLQHLKYMKAVIKETFRLHPPVPLLVPRESIEPCIVNGFEIPAKTRVVINTYAIGRDPESWSGDPLEFNPDRFMGDDQIDFKGQQGFELLPFGGGRRGCPGYAFGLATIEIALARLLYHFDWALEAGVKAEDVDLSEIFGLATRKKVPLVLVPSINKVYEFKGGDA